MKFLSSLDAKDRKLLLWCVGIGLSLAVAIGFLLPSGNSNDNPLPSSYLSGQHGARAAYETLLRSNYQIERWERPLPIWPPQPAPIPWSSLPSPSPANHATSRPCARFSSAAAACSPPARWAASFCPLKPAKHPMS